MVFLDASALVKLYIVEQGSDQVVSELRNLPVGISRLALVEVTSAIERRRRARELSAPAAKAALEQLDQDQGGMYVIDLSLDVIQRARLLCGSHPLRASDAIQLASALQLQDRVGGPIRFVCFDDRLNQAAQAEDLDLAIPVAP